ncbi:MAG: hypothetical protein SNH35_08565 [Rikenellaceae bacterium]
MSRNQVYGFVSQRIISLGNEEFGFLDKYKMEQDFLEYYLKVAKTKHSKWIMVYKHFHHFAHGKCQFIVFKLA